MSKEEFLKGYHAYFETSFATKRPVNWREIEAWKDYVASKGQEYLFSIVITKAQNGPVETLRLINEHYDLIESPLYQALK